jgi:ubiquinone/menaquinone biosynthesis C-methylase UbiE
MRGRAVPRLLLGLAVFLAAKLVGAERWARLARGLDRRSGLFTTWGAGPYSRIAPRLLRGFYRCVADDVVSGLSRGAVLDVGAGPGTLALEIARRQPSLEVVGVDISPEMLAIARANAQREGLDGRVRFETGDAARLPFADRSFDLVVSTLSLHHWPDLAASLRELHRVLRPGGRAWLYDVRALSHSAREFRAAAAETPFAGQSIERRPVHAGWLPVAPFVRFALTRH